LSAFVVTVIVHGWAKAGAAYTIQIKAHRRARTLKSSPRFMAKASFILAFWSDYNLLKKKVKTYERDCEKQGSTDNKHCNEAGALGERLQRLAKKRPFAEFWALAAHGVAGL
jgi:hypothetical protein